MEQRSIHQRLNFWKKFWNLSHLLNQSLQPLPLRSFLAVLSCGFFFLWLFLLVAFSCGFFFLVAPSCGFFLPVLSCGFFPCGSSLRLLSYGFFLAVLACGFFFVDSFLRIFFLWILTGFELRFL